MRVPEFHLTWTAPLQYEGDVRRADLSVEPITEFGFRADTPRWVRAAAGQGMRADSYYEESFTVGVRGQVKIVAWDPDLDRIRRILPWNVNEASPSRWSADVWFGGEIFAEMSAPIWGGTPEQLFDDAVTACTEVGGWPEVETIIAEMTAPYRQGI